MGRFRGKDMVRNTFTHRNVVPGSTKFYNSHTTHMHVLLN